jgi:orotate phosphoribosyltransferase
MILNEDQAIKVAEFLLQIKAIKLSPNEPFTWASGIKSPIYCDNRVTLSYPTIRTYIRQAYAQSILDHYGKPDVIAGVATGGIALGALVAQELNLPFIYVRSSAKEHGLGNQIEGFYEKGQKVVVIEDLISTGGSSLKAVDALRDGGLEVKGLIAIFTYGFDVAHANFANSECPYVTLSDYNTMVGMALDSNLISKDDLESLKDWRANPKKWKQ